MKKQLLLLHNIRSGGNVIHPCIVQLENPHLIVLNNMYTTVWVPE